MNPLPLEFWFDFVSTYSYVAAQRVEREASAAGVSVVWRPFLLGPLFHEQQGIKDSPFNKQPVRGRYMWRDLERLCEKFALPWKRPSVFPRNSVLAARVACFGATTQAEWLPAFTRAVFEANFARDEDISAFTVLSGILSSLGQPGADILGQAVAPENNGLLRAATDAARAHGMFGAPSFIVGNELFFGQDRLTDSIEWATASHR